MTHWFYIILENNLDNKSTTVPNVLVLGEWFGEISAEIIIPFSQLQIGPGPQPFPRRL